MGNKIVLTGTSITDLTAPVLFAVDPLECSGSLALIEPGHPVNPFVGVPSNGASFPNLLAAKALVLIPSTTTALLASLFTHTTDFVTPGALIERSTKGGLHLIQSVATPGVATRGAWIRGQGPIRDYLIANPTHDVFVSLWGHCTRVPTAANASRSLMLATTGDWFRFYGRYNTGDNVYPTGATRIGYRQNTPSAATVGPYLTNVGHRPNYAPLAGTNLTNYNAGNSAPSWTPESGVFYRFYMEDLTVSGRTYAQVDALDFAEYTRQVLTAGGRYYGDTVPTDPVTSFP